MLLDEFLGAGLIPIGGDDDKFKKLLDSVEELEKILKEDNKKIINYTLVALDENILENEPILLEVEEIVKKHWQLVRGQFNQMPVGIYQGIILQALFKISEEDDDISTIIWLTSNSVYPLLTYSTQMNIIIKDFLHRLGDKVETHALSKWTIEKEPIDIRLAKLQIKAEKLQAIGIDQEALFNYLNAACGPTNKQNQSIPDANPHWANQQSYIWSHEFATRASKGISDVINPKFEEQNKVFQSMISNQEKQINEYFAKIKNDISSALQDAIQSSVAVERRSQLLWWKETLYSTTQRKSYRDLDTFQSSIAMAFDLFDFLPLVCPVSVDYILKETFIQLKSNTSTTIGAFLNEVNKPEKEVFLKKYFQNREKNSNRENLVDYISEIVYNKINIEEATIQKLGLPIDKEIKYEEISIWILHCLLAKRLTA